jgi:hypothetical protein
MCAVSETPLLEQSILFHNASVAASCPPQPKNTGFLPSAAFSQEPDSEGVPDEQLATTAWTNYRQRNDSHIVDHFQGLYKSTLVCPQCSYSSMKFDPFMYLSLPLPESKVKQLCAILLHADGAAPPREYGLEVSQSGVVVVCRQSQVLTYQSRGGGSP